MSRHPYRASLEPLFGSSEAWDARTVRRRLIGRIALTSAGIALVLLSAALPPAPRLVWNGSASAPIGLYAVTPGAWVEPGDTVIALPPARDRQMAAERHYLPLNVPLVKHVAAYGGDKICAHGQNVFVNGRRAALRLSTDSRGRPMPMWSGCIRLHGRQLFLLNNTPESFDGRYFGVTEGDDIIGKARLLWSR